MNAVCNASVKPQNTISIPANNKGKDISSHPLQSRDRLSKDLKSAKIYKVPFRHQPKNRETARTRGSPAFAGICRRGDRVKRRKFIARRNRMRLVLIGFVTVAAAMVIDAQMASAINYDSFFQERYCSRRATGGIIAPLRP